MQIIDMTGYQSGLLTVIKRDTTRKDNNGAYWLCQCECGNIISVRGSVLRNKKRPIRSCGCERTRKLIEYNQTNNIKDISNQWFGYLQAIEPTNKRTNGKAVIWKCRCKCGAEIEISGADLRSGNTTSCGCQRYNSQGESIISLLLAENNIPFVKEKYFDDLIFEDTGHYARFDFYVNNSYIIEYDGQQHFIQGNGAYDNKEKFTRTREHDQIKNKYCYQHNIPIIRIPYTELNNITLEMLQPETSPYRLADVSVPADNED